MGKTLRRDQSFKPRGKDFKKSNKFKKWHDKLKRNHAIPTPDKDVVIEEELE
jgi:hypothetical protein